MAEMVLLQREAGSQKSGVGTSRYFCRISNTGNWTPCCSRYRQLTVRRQGEKRLLFGCCSKSSFRGVPRRQISLFSGRQPVQFHWRKALLKDFTGLNTCEAAFFDVPDMFAQQPKGLITQGRRFVPDLEIHSGQANCRTAVPLKPLRSQRRNAAGILLLPTCLVLFVDGAQKNL